MSGLAAASGVYVIFLILEDTLRTAISGFVYEQSAQSYVYQSVVWLATAFIGSFIARRNFLSAIIFFASLIWLLRVSDYVMNFASAAIVPPTKTELLMEVVPYVFISLISVFIGSLTGQRFARPDPECSTGARYTNRKRALFLSVLCLFVLLPQAYSAYWYSEARREARKAFDLMMTGTMPENVTILRDMRTDEAYPVDQFLEAYSNQSEVLAVHKNAQGFHGYDIRILTDQDTSFVASADYFYGEWTIFCCDKY